MSQNTDCIIDIIWPPVRSGKPQDTLLEAQCSISAFPLDLSSWVPGAPSQYSKVGALELSAILAATAKPHINITPQSARHKMFGF